MTGHVTTADLFSHRSGLPDHAGDLLEDLGYDRSYILDHLRLEPLTPFRASYAYTNFGLTAAAEAVARAKGTSWQKLADDTLFKPAGMTDTSTEFSAFINNPDRAATHVKNPDGTWSARSVRNPDAQAPAGGVSSTARDMSRWLRLQLADGTLDGKRIIPADTLARTHVPEIVSQPPATPTARTGFYGLGWNVSYDDAGSAAPEPLRRLRVRRREHQRDHAPAGEARHRRPHQRCPRRPGRRGRPRLLRRRRARQGHHGLAGARRIPLRADGSRGPLPHRLRPPARRCEAARDSAAYTGTYDNPYYGRATVTADDDGALTLALGPKPLRFPLTHYDADTFSFETTGENAVGRTGVTFADGTLRVEYLDANHLGTFTRQ